MQLGRARVLAEGRDIAILSSGICTEEVMRITAPVQARGLSLRHLHISTHKPFDDPTVSEALAAARLGVITIENHTIMGGLGSAVAELMAEAGLGKRLIRLGIKDQRARCEPTVSYGKIRIECCGCDACDRAAYGRDAGHTDSRHSHDRRTAAARHRETGRPLI
ncbi:MAG: transketolase C-terminal domain-containing protein [Pirellulaceae bacterium]